MAVFLVAHIAKCFAFARNCDENPTYEIYKRIKNTGILLNKRLNSPVYRKKYPIIPVYQEKYLMPFISEIIPVLTV